MKVVFMGTPDFSVGTLKAIVEAGHEVAAVVTQPDKPKGRGGAMSFSDVKQAAIELGLLVLQPKRARDEEFVNELRKINPDVIVVVAFGQILSKEILDMPKYGCVNVHASLLPKYRGASPIQWAVIDGCEYSGVTTMMMNEGIDTGDILLVEKVKLDTEDGIKVYDVEFYAGNVEYDFEIDAVKGTVLKFEKDGNPDDFSKYIGEAKAKEIALAKAGLAASQVYGFEIELDDGVYEIEFKYNGMEYSMDINAVTGTITDFETEYDD